MDGVPRQALERVDHLRQIAGTRWGPFPPRAVSARAQAPASFPRTAHRLLAQPAVQLQALCVPVAVRSARPQVDHLPQQCVPELGVVEVPQNVDAQLALGYEAGDRRPAVHAARVHGHEEPPVVLLEPAEAVGRPARTHEWERGAREARGRDDGLRRG